MFCRRSAGESERREHSGKDVLAGDSPHSEQVRPFGVFESLSHLFAFFLQARCTDDVHPAASIRLSLRGPKAEQFACHRGKKMTPTLDKYCFILWLIRDNVSSSKCLAQILKFYFLSFALTLFRR